jgi:long-chain fatty acid transport protein
MKLKKIAALLAVAGFAAPVFATNGMNMEGYGPVATGMGGASYAYDNGTAGMINNPATLGFMKSGTSRLDIAIGGLHPDVTSKMAGAADANSGGDAYYMPAVGYIRKDGRLAWGIGMMAQGGMGTEYGKNSFLSMGSGQEVRTELGIGRILFPVSFDVSENLRIGGSVDYLWGGLDLQMVMSGAQLGAMMAPGGAAFGVATTNMALPPMAWAQFDFSQGSNKFKQELTTSGWGWNLGFTWKLADNIEVGGVYHAKTSLDDMSGKGRLNNNVLPLSGKLKVIDFQWPETYGIGLAYQATDKLMIVADYKRINWADVMKDFHMRFETAGGGWMEAKLYQNWDDQNVIMIGGAYKYTDALTLRAGVNLANNPIPNKYLNYLFPATIKNHVALGFGYSFNPSSSIDFSYSYAPKVSGTNANMGNIKTVHSQSHNWQFMYSHRF